MILDVNLISGDEDLIQNLGVSTKKQLNFTIPPVIVRIKAGDMAKPKQKKIEW